MQYSYNMLIVDRKSLIIHLPGT